jgi:hypothetical protein
VAIYTGGWETISKAGTDRGAQIAALRASGKTV